MRAQLDRRLTAVAAELLIERFSERPPDRLELDVDILERFELLAESRIAGLLTMARRTGVPIRLLTGQAVNVEARRSKRLVDLFSETLGGVILAQMANELIDRSGSDRRPQVIRRQAEHAVETGGFFGFGRERAAPIVDLFGGPPTAPMVDDKVGIDFDPLFRSWVTRTNLPMLSEPLLESLIRFAFETFDNSHRHGSRDLERRTLEGVRFVLLRTINLRGDDAATVAERVATGPVAEYLTGLTGGLGKREFLVELTVSDCGVGIPATLARTTDVYTGSWEGERDETLGAFEEGRTSRGASGVGRGLPKALHSAGKLKGLIVLRTGRTLLHRNFLPGRENGWQAEQLPLMPGTAVSLIFPWRDPRPPTLFEP
jgi:hypothetical protein